MNSGLVPKRSENDLATLDEVAERLLTFQELYEELAEPVRVEVHPSRPAQLMKRLSDADEDLRLVA